MKTAIEAVLVFLFAWTALWVLAPEPSQRSASGVVLREIANTILAMITIAAVCAAALFALLA